MDRLHVGERVRAADFLLLYLDVLLAALTGGDGLVYDRRWRLTRLRLELTNLDGLGCMLPRHSHNLLLLLRSRLSQTVLLGLRWRLYRTLVDDLRTTLQDGCVSGLNLMVSGWNFASLYDDLLGLLLGLTSRELVDDVRRMLLLLWWLLLLIAYLLLLIGYENLVVLLHSRGHWHIAQLLHVLWNVDQQVATARLMMSLRLSRLVDDRGVLVDRHRLMGHRILDDDLLRVLRRPSLRDHLRCHLDV